MVFGKKKNVDNTIDYGDDDYDSSVMASEQTPDGQSSSLDSSALLKIQKQVGELAKLIQTKDQEINELRGNIRSDKSTFSALNAKINKLEKSVSSGKSYNLSAPGKLKALKEDSSSAMDSSAMDSSAMDSSAMDSSAMDSSSKEGDFEDDLVESDDESSLEEPMIPFDEDTFSLMMLHPVRSRDWVLAVMTVVFQWCFLVLIIVNLNKGNRVIFNVAYSVPIEVTIGQYLGIFICVGVQTDILSSVRMIAAMFSAEDYHEIIGEDEPTKLLFFMRILLPMTFKFIGGVLVLVCNFITIVSSTNIVDLMKDVAALLIISEVTEILFQLAAFGFMGSILEDHAKEVPETEVEDVFAQETGLLGVKFCNINPRLTVFLVLVISMASAVTLFVSNQINGQYFFTQYPYCTIPNVDIVKFGDGVCDGGLLNSIECDFDGGDCVNFNLAYPNCEAQEPSRIGDGTCDEIYNSIECKYDGADCCPFGDPSRLDELEDGNRLKNQDQCDGGQYSTKKCKYDAGACDALRIQHQGCDFEEIGNLFDKNDYAPVLGDGICESSVYNNDECGYEFGDCEDCNSLVFNTNLTGDGICHGGWHNSDRCNSDARDCIAFNLRYPRCAIDAERKLDPTKPLRQVPVVGDGICNSGLYNNADCGFEDGDCLLCNELVDDVDRIGDGICDGQNYMSLACGRDGGDCAECPYSQLEIGNGWCTTEYNTPECGYDGGDCAEFNSNYQNCAVQFPSLLSNGYCNGGIYNTAECNWDGGDCLEQQQNFGMTNCNVERPDLLGDNVCHGGEYNTEECSWDAGDCLVFNANYPDCKVEFPELIANGWCSGGEYDTEDCKYDGGDCLLSEQEVRMIEEQRENGFFFS